MAFLYLVALSVSLAGMVVVDRRYRLFFWADARRAALVMLVGIVLFVAWDAAGIGLGIFFRGETVFMTGVLLAPEFPIEEAAFLALLCYFTMNVFATVQRLTSQKRSS